MALLVARFMRFFTGYTAEMVLKMPARRFFALNRKISRIQAEEEALSLMIYHNSKPGDRLNQLIQQIKGVKHGKPSAAIVIESVAGEAGYEETPGEIAALRERQKQAAERIEREKAEWQARRKSTSTG